MNPSHTDLTALLARVEAATGPDRALDCHIALACGWEFVTVHHWHAPKGFRLPLGTLANPPFFTSSLDVTLALCSRVLPGWTFANINQDDTKRWWSELREGYQTSFNRVAISGPCPAPALALLVAMLRAKIAETTPTTHTGGRDDG